MKSIWLLVSILASLFVLFGITIWLFISIEETHTLCLQVDNISEIPNQCILSEIPGRLLMGSEIIVIIFVCIAVFYVHVITRKKHIHTGNGMVEMIPEFKELELSREDDEAMNAESDDFYIKEPTNQEIKIQ